MHTEQVKDYYIRKKKFNVTIQQNNTKMFNFDYLTEKDIKEHNPNCPEIPDHLYRILIAGSGEKMNYLIE